jgi:glycosyltransferase involved in cell wall biosynthesis
VAGKLIFAYPGDLNTLTGGYLYDKQVIEGLRKCGWKVQTLSLDPGFPMVSDAVKAQTIATLAGCASDHLLVVDGLALGALGHHIDPLTKSRPYMALVHHPLALESGLSPQAAKALHQSEQLALAHAQRIVVTSPITAQTLTEQFEVPRARIHVVIPGIDQPKTVMRSRRPPENRALELLSVGALVPRKGFEDLVKALARIGPGNWRLTIVGDPTRSPPTTQSLKSLIKASNLDASIELVGAVAPERLRLYYQNADLFVLASHYEGYGMAYAEALAWGLPVIGTNAGAVSQTVPAQAGILVNPHDTAALADALKRVMSDPACQAAMMQAALQHGQTLPSWDETAFAFGQAISADRR